MGLLTCPACKAAVDPTAGECPQCGAALRGSLRHGFRCRSCGAAASGDIHGWGTTCVFCGAPTIDTDSSEVPCPVPDRLIPFRVVAERARELFQDWLGHGFFRPGDLASPRHLEELRGIYIPFWSFSCRAHSHWTAEAGYHRYHTEPLSATGLSVKSAPPVRQMETTEWQSASGDHDCRYDHELVAASAGMPQDWSDDTSAYDFTELTEARPDLLTGWAVEECAVDREQARGIAAQSISAREEKACALEVPGDEQRSLQATTTFSDVRSALHYLPVWISSYRYRDRIYRCIINGQTGIVYGTAPVSRRKVAAAIFGGLLVIGVLYLYLRAS